MLDIITAGLTASDDTVEKYYDKKKADPTANVALAKALIGNKSFFDWPSRAWWHVRDDFNIDYPVIDDKDFKFMVLAYNRDCKIKADVDRKAAGGSDAAQWQSMLKEMGIYAVVKDEKKWTNDVFYFVLRFMIYNRGNNSVSGVSLKEAMGHQWYQKLVDKYWKVMLDKKGGSGISKFLGTLSMTQYSKDVLPFTKEAMAGGTMNLSFPPVIYEGANGYEIATIDVVDNTKGRKTSWVQGMAEWLGAEGTTTGKGVQGKLNPLNVNDAFPGKEFYKRKWQKQTTDKRPAIPLKFKEAIQGGIKTLDISGSAGTQAVVGPHAPGMSVGGSVEGSDFQLTNYKDPAGTAQIKDLRDLPTGKGYNLTIYDGIEKQIEADYMAFLNQMDVDTIEFKNAKDAGADLKAFYAKATKKQLYKDYAKRTGLICANLLASTRLRAEVLIFWEKLAAEANKPENAELTDEAEGSLGAKAMGEAKTQAASELAAGLEAAGAAANRAAEIDRLTEDEINEKRRYVKQCALTLNYSLLRQKYREKRKSQKGSGIHKGGPWGKRFYMVDTKELKRRDIMSQLFSPFHANIAPFMKLTPDLVSALTPKIRLYKVWSGKCELIQQEIAFPNYEDPSRISSLSKNLEGVDRGNACGIKSLNWVFEGTNPAEARSAIGVELTLFFQSFRDLIEKRKPDNWSYIDLLLHPWDEASQSKNGEAANPYISASPNNYRVRMDIGWQEITGEQTKIFDARGPDISASNINEAIKRMNKSFYLVMVDHEMDLKENGNIEIKASYRAYIESALQNKQLDALSSPMVSAARAQFGANLQHLIETDKCSVDQYKELRAQYAALEEEFRLASYRSIMKRMMARGCIHTCKINRNQLGGGFKLKGGAIFEGTPTLEWPNPKTGTFGTKSKDSKAIEKEAKETPKEKATAVTADKVKQKVEAEVAKKAKETVTGKKDEEMKDTRTFEQLPSLKDAEDSVNFFFMGDLLYTILDCMYEPKSKPKFNQQNKEGIEIFGNMDSPENQAVGKRLCHLKNLNIVLPSFDHVDMTQKKKNEIIGMNVAEIPVAVDYFLEFMTQKVIKARRKSYPVMQMMMDLTKDCVIDILSENCVDLRMYKKTEFSHTAFVGAASGTDPLKKLIDGHGILWTNKHYKKNGKLPIRAVEDSMHAKDLQHYLVLYPKNGDDRHNGTGQLKDDEKAGCYHYEIGARSGILKKIKFTKTDIEYSREARFMEQGNDGLLQLSNVYRATIEMVGNTLYYPGMTLWIEPTSLGVGQEMDPRVGPPGKGKGRGSAANALGFGGYHFVERVRGSITNGKFNTTVEALWVDSGGGKKSGVAGEPSSPTGTTTKEASKPGNNKAAAAAGGAEEGGAAEGNRMGEKAPGKPKMSPNQAYCNTFIKHAEFQLQHLHEQATAGQDGVGVAGMMGGGGGFGGGFGGAFGGGGGAIGTGGPAPAGGMSAKELAEYNKKKGRPENLPQNAKKFDPDGHPPPATAFAFDMTQQRWVEIGWYSGDKLWMRDGTPITAVNPPPPDAGNPPDYDPYATHEADYTEAELNKMAQESVDETLNTAQTSDYDPEEEIQESLPTDEDPDSL